VKTVRFFLFVFLSLSIFQLVSCNKDDNSTDPPDQQDKFSFVKVGNLWTYSTSYQGTTYPDMTYQVLSNFANNVYKVKQTYPSSNQTGTTVQYIFWYCTESEYASVSDSTGNHKMMIFNNNIKLNQEYSFINHGDTGLPEGDTVYYKLLSETEIVSVPAGTFTCAKMSLYFTPYRNRPVTYIYSSKSAGTIKIENDFSKFELKSKNF